MAEDEETEMLVTDLKYRIANKGLHTQSFLTVEELGQKVLEDWVAIINQFYPPMLKLPEGISKYYCILTYLSPWFIILMQSIDSLP